MLNCFELSSNMIKNQKNLGIGNRNIGKNSQIMPFFQNELTPNLLPPIQLTNKMGERLTRIIKSNQIQKEIQTQKIQIQTNCCWKAPIDSPTTS